MANPSDILKRMQQQAVANTLDGHLLGERSSEPQGLLVFCRDADCNQLRQQVCTLLAPAIPSKATAPMSAPSHGTRQGSLSRNIAELLEVEQARVAKTRLPCALLLVELDDFASINESDAAMDYLIDVCQERLEAVDILSVYQRGKIVIILPGINRRLARNRAAAIGEALRSSSSPLLPGSDKMTVSIAAALYRATDSISPAELLQRTAAELAGRGSHKNCLLFLDKEVEAEATCQVTVEERNQLFSILD